MQLLAHFEYSLQFCVKKVQDFIAQNCLNIFKTDLRHKFAENNSICINSFYATFQQNQADLADKILDKQCRVHSAMLRKELEALSPMLNSIWCPEKPFLSSECIEKLHIDLCLVFMKTVNGQIKSASTTEAAMKAATPHFEETYRSFLTLSAKFVKPGPKPPNLNEYKAKAGDVFLRCYAAFKVAVDKALVECIKRK